MFIKLIFLLLEFNLNFIGALRASSMDDSLWMFITLERSKSHCRRDKAPGNCFFLLGDKIRMIAF